MMTSGLTATKLYAAGSTLPICTDPTGQNLPCMMIISTLPPPANAIQCQESSGQLLLCSYATQNLSNGEEVMVITVYVPAGFVFSPGTVKVVERETERTVINPVTRLICPPFTFCSQHHTADFLTGYDLGSQDGSVGVYDLAAACEGKTGAALEHCIIGYKDAYVTTCHDSKFGCGDGPTACPPGESPTDCHVPPTGPSPGPTPCHGPYTPGVTSLYPCSEITSLPVSGEEKQAGSTCEAGNCTAGATPPTGIDCTKSPSDPSCQQQQHHTAAYLQALNSGAPNPYRPGTKDYEHYQAGLDARPQRSGAGTSPTSSTPSGPSTGPSGNSSPSPSSSAGSGSSDSAGSSSGSGNGSGGSSSGGSSGSDGGGGSGGSSGSGDSGSSGATTKK